MALAAAQWDALVCSRPPNVLLLSGYWPVVGTSVAIALPNDRIWLIVPEDEEELARQGWADEVITFQPGSLTSFRSAGDALREPLRELLLSIEPEPARIGIENSEATIPVTYAAMHLYGSTLPQLLHEFLPHCALQSAGDVLGRLRSVATPFEMSRIGAACRFR